MNFKGLLLKQIKQMSLKGVSPALSKSFKDHQNEYLAKK